MPKQNGARPVNSCGHALVQNATAERLKVPSARYENRALTWHYHEADAHQPYAPAARFLARQACQGLRGVMATTATTRETRTNTPWFKANRAQ